MPRQPAQKGGKVDDDADRVTAIKQANAARQERRRLFVVKFQRPCQIRHGAIPLTHDGVRVAALCQHGGGIVLAEIWQSQRCGAGKFNR